MNRLVYQFIFYATVTILSAVALYFVSVFAFWIFSTDKIYPGVKVAGVDLSGKTKTEALTFLEEKVAAFQKEKINFSGTESTLVPVTEIEMSCDIAATVDRAYRLGRDNPFILGKKREIILDCSSSFDKVLSQIKFVPNAAENAKLEGSGENLKFKEGIAGKRLNYAELSSRLQKSLGNLELKVILPEFEVAPTFTLDDFEKHQSEIIKKTSDNLILLDGTQEYLVDLGTLIGWVGVGSGKNISALNYGSDPLFSAVRGSGTDGSIFSYDAVSNYLVALSPKINVVSQNAKLGAKDGQVVVVVPDKEGRALNIMKSTNSIIERLDNNTDLAEKNTVNLVVDAAKAFIRSDNLSEIGLTDQISVGYSTFTGSPANRQHNIKVGALKFNGTLIKPNEEFSFIKTLGPVDASTGYLPELVIKENKTIPEYGGGMCQVSSTAFRAALNAGLPILERTPHSYPVSYYKPYGVDATVYIPKPDLVFKNDTGHYILIQTKIEGTKLSFEFYGTKPKRSVKFAGSENGSGAVEIVEKVTPLIYDAGARGNGSFSAIVWRFIYDESGKLVISSKFVSKYDSPDNYPH